MTEQRPQILFDVTKPPENLKRWPTNLYLIKPSGECAGIERTKRSLNHINELFTGQKKFVIGTPAHNQTTIDETKKQGYIMVDTIDQVPAGAIAVAGPHGSTAEDRRIAEEKGLLFVDTECPLVTVVRKGIEKELRSGKSVILWGKKGHAETRAHLGVNEREFGEEPGRIFLGQTAKEILSPEFLAQIKDGEQVAFYAQTTHNAEEALRIRAELAKTFPHLTSLKADGICYATSDRQFGVNEMNRVAKERGEKIAWIVVGDPTSSNSRELHKLTKGEDGQLGVFALNAGQLEEHRNRFLGYDAIAVTAGASAPDGDILGILRWCEAHGSTDLQTLQLGTDESSYNLGMPEIQDFRK